MRFQLLSFLSLLLLFVVKSATAKSSLSGCRIFKLHRYALHHASDLSLPQQWQNKSIDQLQEKELLEAIGQISQHQIFPEIYKQNIGQLGSTTHRQNFLQCVLSHLMVDSDGDGVPNWTAIVNARPSELLIPLDPDMDGDGIPNIFDVNPYESNPKEAQQNNFPEHLKLEQKDAQAWQEKLYKDFGLIALDFTDVHSPIVLENIYQLLKLTILGEVITQLKVKYLYAFKGHDRYFHQASFHPEMQAISIGGIQNWPKSHLSSEHLTRLWMAMAHEIGHAYLFQFLRPFNFIKIAMQLGPWQHLEQQANSFKLPENELGHADEHGFYHPSFLTPHPKYQSGHQTWRAEKRTVVSQYALTNLHEWFAESFAAYILKSLQAKGHIHLNGPALDKSPKTYWVQYDQLSDDLRQWLDTELSQRKSAQTL